MKRSCLPSMVRMGTVARKMCLETPDGHRLSTYAMIASLFRHRLALGLLAVTLGAACASATATQQPAESVPVAVEAEPSPPTLPVEGPAPPHLPQQVRGTLVLESGAGSLLRLRLPDGRPEPLLTGLPPGAYAVNPAVSPDGKEVALAYFEPGEDGAPSRGMGIGIVPIEGGRPDPLAAPDDPQASYSLPAWSADGRSVYFNAFDPRRDAEGNFTGYRTSLARIPREGGEVEAMIENALFPTLSADGSLLAYLRFDPEGGGESLWIADPNGDDARPLLEESPYLTLQFPKISPDGRFVLYSADPGVALRPWLDRLLGVGPAYAHGMLLTLYLLDVESGQSEQLLDGAEDDVVGAWSPDGRWVAHQATEGFLIITEAATGESYQGPMTGGHGGLA